MENREGALFLTPDQRKRAVEFAREQLVLKGELPCETVNGNPILDGLELAEGGAARVPSLKSRTEDKNPTSTA